MTAESAQPRKASPDPFPFYRWGLGTRHEVGRRPAFFFDRPHDQRMRVKFVMKSVCSYHVYTIFVILRCN